MRISFLGLVAAALLITSCREDGEIPDGALDEALLSAIAAAQPGGTEALLLPAEGDLDALPQDPNNRLTAEKVELGKLLFHETALATGGKITGTEGTYSCASCHAAGAGFQANRWQGIGEGGIGFGESGEGRTRAANVSPSLLDVQPVRSPAALHSGYQELMLWNGQFGATGMNVGTEANWTPGTPKAVNELGFEGVETQAIAGLAVHRMDVTDELLDEFGYRSRFDAVFGDYPESERYTRTTVGLALAAYERTLVANRAPFQQWLGGSVTALSDAEKRGAIVFFGDGNCASCHNGPSLASMSFHALGMSDLFDCPEPVFQTAEGQAAHRGRGGFTLRPEDMFAFKTPQLYNLNDSRFYGHGASFRSVRNVVEYKNTGRAENQRVLDTQLSPAFVPLGLSEQQVDDLVAFLEGGLYDAELGRYEPTALLSGKCFPNADVLSAIEGGCN